MHYNDDDELPSAASRQESDDELVGPRRGRPAPRSEAEADAEDADELVGRRRPSRFRLDEEDDGAVRRPAPARRGGRGRSRRRGGEEHHLLGLVREIPSFVKLLVRVVADKRVSVADKLIVGGALAYLALPTDLIPDAIPYVGEIEDMYLLALALGRLLKNAGSDVLLDHWDGDVDTLESALSLLDQAGNLLPGPVRSLVSGAR